MSSCPRGWAGYGRKHLRIDAILAQCDQQGNCFLVEPGVEDAGDFERDAQRFVRFRYLVKIHVADCLIDLPTRHITQSVSNPLMHEGIGLLAGQSRANCMSDWESAQALSTV